MQKKRKLAIIISSFLILLIIGVYIRLKNNSSENAKRPRPIENIVIGKTQRGEMVQIEFLNGDILPIQQSSIYSKVNGNIEKIYVNIGDFVKQGQTLALVDTTIYSQNAKQANASFLQAQANLENAKLNYERNKSLLEQNLISKQDVDNAKTAYDVAKAQKDAQYASYSNAITQLSYCRITAPFTGVITKRFFDAGVYVTSSASSASSNLFILMDVSKLKAIINLPENDVPLLPKIIDIIVTVDALPGLSFTAKINKISEAVDLSTRTMQVEIYIDNAGKLLKPGMFANINLILNRKNNALILPSEVVLNDPKGDYVFLVNADSTVHKTYVQVGIKQNNKAEIVSGIDDNNMIVFTGQTLVKDGAKVRIAR